MMAVLGDAFDSLQIFIWVQMAETRYVLYRAIIPMCDGFFDLKLGLPLERLLFDLHLQRNFSQHLLMY